MKMLLFALLLPLSLHAADLPTVTVDHLYYLQSRAERIKKLKSDEMIDYCLAQKIGGDSFENLYAQIFAFRLEVTKLTKIDERPSNDPRVVTLTKSIDAYVTLLREEAQKVKNGILHEGQVATDTLSAIARAQQQ